MINFKAKKQWRVVVVIETDNGDEVEVEHIERFPSYNDALQLIERIKPKHELRKVTISQKITAEIETEVEVEAEEEEEE